MDSPLSLNLYAYVLNNPLIYVDPTGHWEQGDENLDRWRQDEIAKATDAYYNDDDSIGQTQANLMAEFLRAQTYNDETGQYEYVNTYEDYQKVFGINISSNMNYNEDIASRRMDEFYNRTDGVTSYGGYFDKDSWDSAKQYYVDKYRRDNASLYRDDNQVNVHHPALSAIQYQVLDKDNEIPWTGYVYDGTEEEEDVIVEGEVWENLFDLLYDDSGMLKAYSNDFIDFSNESNVDDDMFAIFDLDMNGVIDEGAETELLCIVIEIEARLKASLIALLSFQETGAIGGNAFYDTVFYKDILHVGYSSLALDGVSDMYEFVSKFTTTKGIVEGIADGDVVKFIVNYIKDES